MTYLNLFKFFLFVIITANIFYKVNEYIRIGIYTYGLKGGGTERATALLINYLSIDKIFIIYYNSYHFFSDC